MFSVSSTDAKNKYKTEIKNVAVNEEHNHYYGQRYQCSIIIYIQMRAK